jgi:protein CpxP
MKLHHLCAQALLAATCLAPLAGFSQTTTPNPHDGMMAHRGHGQHGMHRGLPFLRGVKLSDAQREQVKAIMQQQQTQRREQHEQLRNAHEALRALAQSGQFDEGKAAALAQTAGQAMAAMALQQARTESQVIALLTPEQRQQMADAQARHRDHS